MLAVEGVGGLVTGSLALLSDATHVGVDVVALLVGFAAARYAAREPTDPHTSGYHRFEAIGALANAVLLVYHSDRKTHGPSRGRIGINAHHQLIARLP